MSSARAVHARGGIVGALSQPPASVSMFSATKRESRGTAWRITTPAIASLEPGEQRSSGYTDRVLAPGLGEAAEIAPAPPA